MPADLADRVLQGVGARTGLEEVCRGLGELAAELLDATSCGVFAVDDGYLCPVVSVGASPAEEISGAFRRLEPISADEAWRRLAPGGRTRPLTGSAVLTALPSAWADRVGGQWAAVAPLVVGPELVGALLLLRPGGRPYGFRPARLEALAAGAAGILRTSVAAEAAARRADGYRIVAEAAGRLASSTGFEDVVGALSATAAGLFDGPPFVLAFLHQGAVLSASVRRGAPRRSHRAPGAALARRLMTWRERQSAPPGAGQLIEVEPDERLHLPPGLAYRLWDVVVGGEPAGGVLVGLAPTALPKGDRLARLADAARLAGACAERYRAGGVRVLGVAYRDPRLAERLGGDVAGAGAGTAARSPGEREGETTIPLRAGRRRIGALRIASGSAPEHLALADQLAAALGHAVDQAGLRADYEELAADRAVAAERERFAADLHDTAGQAFVAIGLLAHRLAEDLPGGTPLQGKVLRLAALADEGKWHIEQAVRAVAFVPAARRGLAPSLRSLARSLAADSGIDIEVDVQGQPARLGPPAERALYRVAHEALTNAWRHARCAFVRVELRFDPDEVVLRVLDDGVGLSQRFPRDGLHMGVEGMRRTMAEVGGELRVRSGEPRGAVVEARLKQDGKGGR